MVHNICQVFIHRWVVLFTETSRVVKEKNQDEHNTVLINCCWGVNAVDGDSRVRVTLTELRSKQRYALTIRDWE